jgi:MFS family permease
VKRYRAVLGAPHVPGLVFSMLLARLPVGLNGLAIVLYLREQTGSFAIAGGVAGSLAAGVGLGAPATGRAVDRLGQWRVLFPCAVGQAAAIGTLVLATEASAPVVLLLLCGFAAGALNPPTSSILRSAWPWLLAARHDLLQGAYAIDTLIIESILITGPLIVGLIAVLTSPAAALALSAACVLIGTALFTTRPVLGRARPEGRPRGLGALSSPGVRAILMSTLPAGIGVGSCQVGLPAFAHAVGAPGASGPLMALFSLGSAGGALLYGALPNRRSLPAAHLTVAIVLPLGIVALAAPSTVAAMAPLVLVAGCCVAPLVATRNELIGGVAPPDALTEAYTWPVTAFVGGIAIGQALAGSLAEGPGWRFAFLVGAAFAATGALIAFARRGTVTVAGP